MVDAYTQAPHAQLHWAPKNAQLHCHLLALASTLFLFVESLHNLRVLPGFCEPSSNLLLSRSARYLAVHGVGCFLLDLLAIIENRFKFSSHCVVRIVCDEQHFLGFELREGNRDAVENLFL